MRYSFGYDFLFFRMFKESENSVIVVVIHSLVLDGIICFLM